MSAATRCEEASVGVYAQNTVHWTDWLRTTVGWRGDYYAANVNSIFDANNSGSSAPAIGSPKFTMVLGPFNKTELFFGAGYGHAQQRRARRHHHRRARPIPSHEISSASPLLVRTKGAEVGVRTKIIPGLDSSVSVFLLDQASEIVFNGDAGDTSASRPSRRYGDRVDQQISSEFLARPSMAISRCRMPGLSATTPSRPRFMPRLRDFRRRRSATRPAIIFPTRRRSWRPPASPSARRPAGSKRCAGAISASSPLTEDNAFRSPPTSIFNGRIGYRFENGWRIQLDGLNLLNTKANQITYAYGSLIKTDSLYNLCYPGSDRAGGGLPERRDGLRPASDRAAGGSADAGRRFLALPVPGSQFPLLALSQHLRPMRPPLSEPKRR